MLPGMELMGCTDLAVPPEVMQHVVRVESSFNPYAIGVVGGRLARQPQNLAEAVSTARMLEREGYNFSLGLAQVNRYNLAPQGLATYERAFEMCPNLQAGSRILAECYGRSGKDWGKAFSCYYSGNFVTGYRHGYVQKVVASWRQATGAASAPAIAVVDRRQAVRSGQRVASVDQPASLVARRIEEAALSSAVGQQALAAVTAAGAPPPAQAPATMAAAPVQTRVATPTRRTDAAPSREMQLAALLAGTSGAPVVVQAMGAPEPASPVAPMPAATGGTAPNQSTVTPARDAAFVF